MILLKSSKVICISLSSQLLLLLLMAFSLFLYRYQAQLSIAIKSYISIVGHKAPSNSYWRTIYIHTLQPQNNWKFFLFFFLSVPIIIANNFRMPMATLLHRKPMTIDTRALNSVGKSSKTCLFSGNLRSDEFINVDYIKTYTNRARKSS